MTSSAALLQQALNGGPEAQQSLREYLASHEDPRIRMVAEWAERQRQEAAAAEQTQTVDREAVQEDKPAETRRSSGSRLLRRIRSLQQELHFQREIGDTLAAALGACYLCWGDDFECEQCAGRGTPGWTDPDPGLFIDYIVPALKRIQKHRKASHASRTRDPHTSPTNSESANERQTS